MSEFSNKTHFSRLLISDFFLFFSFILSHPLYFFYFIFFFPYLFKLLSYLSPLFFTTFLLLSVFLTFSSNNNFPAEFTESKVGFVVGAYQAVVERLKSKTDDNGVKGIDQFEELEVYKIVFDTRDFEQNLAHYSPEIEIKEAISTNEVVIPIGSELIDQKERLEEEIGNQKGEKEVKAAISEEQCVKRVSNEREYHLPRAQSEKLQQNPWNFEHNSAEKSVVIPIGSELIKEGKKLGVILHQIDEEQYLPRASSERVQQNPCKSAEIDGYESEMFSTPKSVDKSPSMRSNGSFGSMRKEKEWRRTLACKLFEERHNNSNSEGSEGMDMLWETYETTDSMKLQEKSRSKRGKKIESCNNDEEEDEDDDEEEENEAQLCCLQALKFSAGKMNLGMGKPNLLKISKAFKGIGWLHHVSKKKAYR